MGSTTASTSPPLAGPIGAGSAEAAVDHAPIHERLDRIEALLRERLEEGT
jgi:hypothetical protein